MLGGTPGGRDVAGRYAEPKVILLLQKFDPAGIKQTKSYDWHNLTG